jgi:hypothetical protein
MMSTPDCSRTPPARSMLFKARSMDQYAAPAHPRPRYSREESKHVDYSHSPNLSPLKREIPLHEEEFHSYHRSSPPSVLLQSYSERDYLPSASFSSATAAAHRKEVTHYFETATVRTNLIRQSSSPVHTHFQHPSPFLYDDLLLSNRHYSADTSHLYSPKTDNRSISGPSPGSRNPPLSPPRAMGSPGGYQSTDWHKKRSRTTRACQNCRLKKTRCDAVGAFPDDSTSRGARSSTKGEGDETNDLVVTRPCTDCTRNGSECFYSKKHVKRGPNRGYIKELERRLDSLESSLDSRSMSSPKRALRDSQDRDTSCDEDATESPRKKLMRLENVMEIQAAPPSSNNASETKIPSFVKLAESLRMQDTDNEFSAPSEADFDSASSTPSFSRSVSRIAGKARQPDTASDWKGIYFSSSLARSFPVLSLERYASTAEMGLSDELVVHAIELLCDPVGGKDGASSSSPAFESSAMSKTSPLHHDRHMQMVIGRAVAGRCDSVRWRNPSSAAASPESTSTTTTGDAIRAQQKAQLGIEADALMLCYMDVLRRGRSSSSLLAAAAFKLAMMRSARQEGAGKKVALMMIDRWHAVGFNTPFHVAANDLKSMDHASLLRLLPAASSQSNTMASQVLRGALAFGRFREALDDLHSVDKRISPLDVEAILCSLELDKGSDAAGHGDPFSTQGMRPCLRNALRAYHALYQLPRISQTERQERVVVMIDSIDRRLQIISGIICVGENVIDSDSQLAKSCLGPFIYSIAATLLAWSSRVIAVKAHDTMTSSLSTFETRSRLEILEEHRRRIYQWLRVLDHLCVQADRPTDACSLSLLYARLATYIQANRSYVARIGNLGTGLTSINDLAADSPIRHDGSLIRRRADGILDRFLDQGPLGLALSTDKHGE